MKIVKIYGVNNINIPENYIKEIVLNHPDDQPLPNGYIILSDNEIESRINKYKDQADTALRIQAEQQELERQEQEKSKTVENIINSISAFTPEQLEVLRSLISV